jgi:glycosyltransferase involved in cell wall biosynthesis
MTISGFSYVRNGLEYGYPFLQAIRSILPVCDEFVIAVGDSFDGTREAIEQLGSPKIKIIDTVWDMNLRKEGKIFALQANTALDHITGDWAFHIQADEVIHENDLSKISNALEKYEHDKRVEGFILPFLHFWGDYNHIRNSRRVHPYEIRIFRNDKLVRSYKDSQGFRKYSSPGAYEQGEKGKKLQVKKIDASIYHYNGVRSPETQKKKVYAFNSRYLPELTEKDQEDDSFDFQQVDRVAVFSGSHPAVMKQRIASQNFQFVFDPAKAVWKPKDKIIQPLEDWLKIRVGEYKNYKLIK